MKSPLALVSLLVLGSWTLDAQTVAPAKRPVVALVLEGGGALGLAHIGVIEVLEEMGIPVDIVVGTSMGAIVGGIYSLGYTGPMLEQVALSTPWSKLLSENPSYQDLSYQQRKDLAISSIDVEFDAHGIRLPNGLLTGRRVVAYLDQIAAEGAAPDNFDDFPRRYRAVATDILTGERVVLSQGSFGDALRASMGVPGLFSPYKIGNRYLVDGGMVSNLPVEVAKEMGADVVLAVHLQNSKVNTPQDLERNPLFPLTRSLDILMAQNVEKQLPLADAVVTVDVSEFSVGDFSRGSELVQAGRRAATQQQATLGALAPKTGGFRTVALHPPRVIRSLEVQGARPYDQPSVEALFRPLVGTTLGRQQLLDTLLRLEAAADYKTVRFSTKDVAGGVELVVSLEQNDPLLNSARIAMRYQATYSGSNNSHIIVAPGVVFRGLTGPGSSVAIDVEAFEAPGIGIEGRQPLITDYFLGLGYQYQQYFRSTGTLASSDYQYRTRLQRTHLDLGYTPVPGYELTAGLRADEIGDTSDLDTTQNYGSKTNLFGVAGLKYLALDNIALPRSGMNFSTEYSRLLPLEADRTTFQTLALAGEFYLPFGDTWSGSFTSSFVTDFSNGTGTNATPLFYRPALVSRRLFSVPYSSQIAASDHLYEAGLSLMYHEDGLSRLVGLPVFLVGGYSTLVALGNSTTDGAQTRYYCQYFSTGIGARLNYGYQFVLQAGVSLNGAGVAAPFVSMDLGIADF